MGKEGGVEVGAAEPAVGIAPLHQSQVARRALVEADARDHRVVLRRLNARVEQLRARLQRALQVEAVDVEHVVDGHP